MRIVFITYVAENSMEIELYECNNDDTKIVYYVFVMETLIENNE